MATERPMRIVESSQTSKWFSSNSKDISAFGSSFKNKANEELEIFLKGQKFSHGQTDFIPSRSGSAPPSMEGSVAAAGNMLPVKDYSLISNSGSLGNALENHKSEGKPFNPSYVAYCSSELNIDPKLPPRHLQSQIGNYKVNQGITSSDNCGTASLSIDEGPDKKGSPKQASESLFNAGSTPKPGQNAALSASLHKSLVDLIQEDFPRTPSPVFNQSHLSSHATTEDSIDIDVHATSSSVSSVDLSNQSDSATCSTSVVEIGTLNIDASELISNEVSLENFPSLQHADGNQSLLEDSTFNKDAVPKDYVSINGVMHAGEHKLRASNVRRQKQEEQYYGRNKQNQSFTHGYAYQVPGAGSQVISQGMNYSQSYLGMLAYSQSQFSSPGIQSSLPSPGPTGPLYATPSAFVTSGNPFYPNFQPSGVFSPQYSLGGYALSPTSVLPYMAGYSSHCDLTLPFEAAGHQDLSGQATGVSTVEGVPNASDFHNRSKIYGHYGLSLQPSYANPLNMQYYPHSFGNAYSAAIQQNSLTSRTLSGGQVCSSVSQQDSAVPAYLNCQKFQSPLHGSMNVPSSKNMGISGTSYFGDSSLGVMTQFPALSLGSPILPSSPRGGINPLSGKNEKKMLHIYGRNAGFSSGQRVSRSFDDSKKQSFLEELKSINSGKFELSDIAGRIIEFSIDQHGSRFIQLKLESCSAEEKASVLEEVLPHASKLMTDVFGNYVIQKIFEHGSPDQRKKLADKLSGQILPLSLQMYGCRALEVIELDQKTLLVQELDGHVMRCVHDQNGNHVIQKCIECIPVEKINFIISAFKGQVPALSTHPYGCRVIQRVLEHCSDEQHIQCIVDEILESAYVLAQDQYGNYVTQHVLKRGKQHEKSQLIRKLTGKIVQLSQHKYASNVIEKCLEHGDAIEREALIAEIIGQPIEGDTLLTMMKDQFANYVIQKVLDICNERHREILLNHIKVHTDGLKKYTYGKHIVARYEQLAAPAPEADMRNHTHISKLGKERLTSRVYDMDSKKSNKIREIVRLQQILKKWKKVASASSSSSSTNTNTTSNGGSSSKGIKFLKRTLSFTDVSCSDNVVPKGFLAVCVGKELKRFIIPTQYLRHPAFEVLLREAEEEFGFQQEGVLKFPCQLSTFQHILKLVEDKKQVLFLHDIDNNDLTHHPQITQMCR
ncbi:pumilio-like protein 5 isoform X1 [Senna tora]|uniref:Pumilio-like protein 5 isoform X1 n=1 Tax=Senna tora TaxID=362788 RepID=A0A834XDA5_9FABA|nr:pumilio-like protein 5 isoform X1 [Senna tora]